MGKDYQEAINQAVALFAKNDKHQVVEEYFLAGLRSIFTDRDNVHLFFRSEVDVPKAEISGAGAAIAIRCRELISKYDEHGYTTTNPVRIYYSSEEFLARNGGNLMYLLR